MCGPFLSPRHRGRDHGQCHPWPFQFHYGRLTANFIADLDAELGGLKSI
jgi:hypothetical protein